MKLLLFLGTALTLVHSGFQTPAFCQLPKDEGTGTLISFSLYYDSARGLCRPFLYSGEGGNANRFVNEIECIRNCSANAENIYPMDRTKACHFPKAVGNCTSNLLRYYYDSVNDRCRKFIYTGCYGNGNRFTDMGLCNSTCHGIHAIICAVLLTLVVVGIIVTIAVLTVKSKQKEAKKKGAGKRKQQDVPLQETTTEVA
ncbi:BPTI/Kunitz domain-containing protein [Boleophthalmus pectinirostris]|uniref:BPTI/Kunitz domain-containing protein n=1 Tax=Boleophthalmus pectinirostris TaxID=150288 RepID=UPI00242BFA44|nr:BPTI/Kunitz domain-containing protein [Boleophthalmus pectinirostris]